MNIRGNEENKASEISEIDMTENGELKPTKPINNAFSSLLNWLKNSEKKNYFLDWYGVQPTSAKVGFFVAIILAFLTHIIAYSTIMLEFHMPGFTVTSAIHRPERWFHFLANSLSFYYMNWVTGILQVLFLSLTVFTIIKAFNIKNRLNAVLIAGVMVTFPAIAETNLYYHDAAPYFFAAFLSVWAFYLTKRYKLGWIAGIFLIMLGLAIYQSKISLAMVASLIHLIIHVTKEKPRILETLKYSLRYLLLIIGGLLAYYASLQVLGLSPTYRGIDGVFSLYGRLDDIVRTFSEVFYYFISDTFRIENQLLTFIYVFVLTMSLISTVVAMVKSRCKSINVISVVILILLLPIAANFSRIFDTGGIGLMQMTSYPFALLLIIPLIFVENFMINTFGLKKLVALALVFIIGYNISFSNFIYLRGEVMTKQAMLFANRVTARIEPLLPNSENNQVFVIGNVRHNPIYPISDLFSEFTPRLIFHQGINLGGVGELAGWRQDYFVNVVKYRVGVNFNHIGGRKMRQELLDKAISDGMPVWPQEGSVAIVDGVVVGMLQFFGRVDLVKNDINNFTATINHTGKSTDLEFEYTWYLYKDGQRLDQIYVDLEGDGVIDHTINRGGSYQFRVFVRFPDGSNVLDVFSETFYIPQIELPSTIYFDSAGSSFERFTFGGLSVQEESGIWTLGHETELSFLLPDTKNDIEFSFSAHPLVTETHPAQIVEIVVNEESLGTLEIREFGTYSITIPNSLIADNLVNLTFLFHTPATPVELQISEYDDRLLALYFEEMTFASLGD